MKTNFRIIIVAALLLVAIGYLFAQTNSNHATARIPAQDANVVAPPAPAPTPTPVLVAAPSPTPIPTPNPAPLPIPSPVPTPSPVAAPALNPVLEQKPIATPQPVAPAEDDFGGVRVYGGLGFNYYQLSENLNTSDATYRSMMTPSYHLGVDLDISKKTALELEYKDTTVRFNNSSVGANSGNGHWQTLSLQVATAIDTISDFLSRVMGDSLEFRLLFGFEAHKMPVALFNNSNQSEVKNLNLIDAEVGGRAIYFFNPKTKLTVFERLQYPIAVSPDDAGASMTARPNLLFDGSIGVDRRIKKDAWLGIYWFGQYNSFNFSYTDSQTNANGSFSAFFSTVELRLTLDF